ncbi:MAG: glycosyltransferase [Acidobacteriota bacterium]
MPAVSVVLRARNEAASLPEVLRALARQTMVEAEWIVVDHGSSDTTPELARGAGARLLRLPEGEFSYGRALNLGFAAARAPVAVSLSAHAAPVSPDWLQALLAPLACADVAASFGPEQPRPDAGAVVRRALRRRYAGLAQHDLRREGGLTFGNANAAVRLDVWRRFRFDEALPYAEDLEWSMRVMAAGYRVVYTPRARVYHSHRDSPLQAHRRAYAEGMAAGHLGRPLRHHRWAGLCATLAAGTLLDAWTLAAARSGPAEWAQALRCRWARSMGGWRGYQAGRRQ